MEGKEGAEALFKYATEGILVVDDKGTIVRINPSAEKLFGYSPDELISRKIEVLVPQRLSSRHNVHRANYGDNPHARSMGADIDLNALRKDGTEFPVEISLSPYTTKEGNFVVAFIVDITSRKQAEEKLKHYSIDLEQQVKDRTLILEEAIDELENTKANLNLALEKEKELNELKSRFVSMASHEFRTPLTTMLSSLSLVTKYGDQNDSENQHRHIEKIKKSIHALTDILNDFLSLSKLEANKIEYHPQEINLKSFIEEIIAELRMPGSQQNILSKYTGNEIILADSYMLRNILFNLISNALKFSPDDRDILISAEVNDSQACLKIIDHGIGISKEDQKHLFERFFRAKNVTHIQGTGLGLTIVARYAELMSADFNIESEEGKGTTCTLKINLK